MEVCHLGNAVYHVYHVDHETHACYAHKVSQHSSAATCTEPYYLLNSP